MKQRKTKFLSCLLAVLVALNSIGITVQAESDNLEWDIVSVGTFDDTTGSIDGEDVFEDLTNGAPLFPGLPEEYVFSEEQLHQKALLIEHADTLPAYNAPDNEFLYVPGELVYLTESEEDAQLAAEAFGGTLDSYANGVAVIRLPSDRTVGQACLSAASAELKLPTVWPNYYLQFYASYNDPALNDGNEGYQWQHAFVGSNYAWDAGYKGQGIKVGVIDSGIQRSHAEFSGRTSSSSASSDANGHGTHVSGIIAANLNNGKGGAGIAPESTLYVYSVTDSKGSVDSASELRALDQAVKDKVDIINMSIGSGMYNGNEDTYVQNAYKAGIAIFAAAGNECTNGKSYPASYSNVCSIAALQMDGKKAPYSNYNDSVDLAFPGSDIYSTYKSSYSYMSGTSMASPVAAGVAAVILSGADSVSDLKGKTGKARVDALYKVMSKNAKKCPSSGTGSGTTWLPSVFNIKVDKGSSVPAAPAFSLKNKTTINAESTTLTISSPSGMPVYYSIDGKTPSFKNGEVVNGTLYNAKGISIGGAKKVTVKAIAVNIAAGKASKVTTATYNFAPNPSAVEVTAVGAVNKLTRGTSVALKASVIPSYAVSTKVKWSVAPEGQGVTINASGKVSVAKTASTGTYTITATAVDKSGNPIASAPPGKYTISVIEASALVKTITLPTKTATLSVKGTLNLADGITVTYGNGNPGTVQDVVWSSSNNEVATVSDKGVVTAIAPGKADIKATANDGSNKSATCKVTVIQPATSIVISGSNKLVAGKSTTLKVTLAPDNASAKTLKWEVSGTGVTVKNGKVTASKTASGAYTITATAQDDGNASGKHTINIISDPIQKITLPKTMSLFSTPGNFKAPASKPLVPEITGGDKTAITYTSSAPNIASVDANGIVTAKSAGKAKITCAATDGSNKKAVCTVTVGVPMSRLDIIAAQENDGILSVGSTLKLKTQVGTSFGTPQSTKVVWSVPDQFSDMISVSSSGVVKATAFNEKKATDSKNPYYIENVYVEAKAADGSGASAKYTFTLIRKITKLTFNFSMFYGYFQVYATLDNGTQINVPYNITFSAPKSNDVGFQDLKSAGYPGFIPTLRKQTTSKTSKFTYADAIKVNMKVKLQTGNKSASLSTYLVKAGDGKQYILY